MPPVDAPQPDAVDARDAEGEAAAVLQAPMLQTLLGDNFAQIRAQQPTVSMGIAIIDSGIEPGPDFGDRITAFYDFTHGDIRAAAPSDEYGHGTHVAGLAASKYVGVDPSARLIGLKVLDGQRPGQFRRRAARHRVRDRQQGPAQHSGAEPLAGPSDLRARGHRPDGAGRGSRRAGGPGGGGVGRQLRPQSRDTALPGYAGIASPGNAPSAFSIGAVRTFNTATRDDDQIALFSSRGPSWYDGFAKPDFSAPGQNLLSVAAAGSTLRIGAGSAREYRQLHAPERHQHGRRRGQRLRGAGAADQSDAHAERAEGRASNIRRLM